MVRKLPGVQGFSVKFSGPILIVSDFGGNARVYDRLVVEFTNEDGQQGLL